MYGGTAYATEQYYYGEGAAVAGGPQLQSSYSVATSGLSESSSFRGTVPESLKVFIGWIFMCQGCASHRIGSLLCIHKLTGLPYINTFVAIRLHSMVVRPTSRLTTRMTRTMGRSQLLEGTMLLKRTSLVGDYA